MMKTAAHLPTVENPEVHKAYHLAWANRGCVWILDSIEGDKCKMHTPATNKPITANLSDLRHTRKNAQRLGIPIEIELK